MFFQHVGIGFKGENKKNILDDHASVWLSAGWSQHEQQGSKWTTCCLLLMIIILVILEAKEAVEWNLPASFFSQGSFFFKPFKQSYIFPLPGISDILFVMDFYYFGRVALCSILSTLGTTYIPTVLRT